MNGVFAGGLVALGLATGCLLVRDVDSLTANGGDVDAGRTADAAIEAGPENVACAGKHGPRGVRLGTAASAGCIDATEVTVGDYRTFVTACEGGSCARPSTCSWNTTFEPTFGVPGSDSDRQPIRFVDWCDAATFCAWAGKRLCGSPDGTRATTSDYQSVAKSTWFAACSAGNDGAHDYPFGKLRDYDPARCNGGDLDAGDVRDVGSFRGCEGGYPGIFDLAGNVREWEDACDDHGTDEERSCLVRGGAFYDIASTLLCANRQELVVTAREPGVGFRCCSP